MPIKGEVQPSAEVDPAGFLDWARRAAIPLNLDDPGDDGLAMVAERWSRARVLGLGEATHGTAEFFRAKGLVLAAIARTGSRPLLAFEAGTAETLAVADAAADPAVSAADAVAGFRFWTWDTHEVRQVVSDLAALSSQGRPVPVVGIDPQFGASSARAIVASLPEAAGPSGTYDLCDDFVTEHLRSLDDHRRAEVLDAGRWWAARARAAAPGDARLRALADALDAWAALAPIPRIDERRRVRDRAMAHAVLATAQTHRPVVVWAHNQHVAVDGFGGRLTSLGGHLRAALDDGYVAVGFSFGGGSLQAIDEQERLRVHHVGRAPDGTLDRYLSLVGPPAFALPVGQAPADVRAWLAAARPPIRSIGAQYAGDQGTWWATDVADQFDWLVHVRLSHAARRTGSGVRVPEPRGPLMTAPVGLATAVALTGAGWSLPTPRPRGGFLPRPAPEGVEVARDGAAHDFGYGALVQRVDAAALRGRQVAVVAGTTGAPARPGSGVRAYVAWDDPAHPDGRQIRVSDPAPVAGRTSLVLEATIPKTATIIRYGVSVTGTEPVVVHDVQLLDRGEG